MWPIELVRVSPRLKTTVTLRVTDDDPEDTFAQVQKWLAPPDPHLNLSKSLKLRTAHTGGWFLKGLQYKAWKSGNTPLTWLYGSAGCGKTIMSAGIIQDMQLYCDNESDRSLAFFFFDFDDRNKQDPIKMIKSVLSQLLNSCGRAPDSVRDLYTVCNDGRRAASDQEVLQVLKDTLATLPAPYLIIDALDECSDWQSLLDIIVVLQDRSMSNLHVLLTSRREAEIESTLEDIVPPGNRICLQSQLVDQDIRRYVHERLERDKAFKRWQKDPKLHDEIERALARKATGMYDSPGLFLGSQHIC